MDIVWGTFLVVLQVVQNNFLLDRLRREIKTKKPSPKRARFDPQRETQPPVASGVDVEWLLDVTIKLMRDNYAVIRRACQQSGRFDEPILFDGTFGDTDMGMMQKEVNAW